ncbi:OsmC family protein [Ohtaekwangia koreensis]|uniref:Putative redox protein n=1 Tax=Ohtaekwangia koreensis TaxID=688867 RepID=A0A1T5M254_9BACT|nr:OsmC family protein [Ohtaekwangia koreensis]SKC82205.1 putative redox protein [Ohtaekwangia koreensis]
MIKIELNRLNDAFHMEARNDAGNAVQMDSSPESGGSNLGMRPMQMLLAAMGGCSAIDVVSILKKQRQDLKDIKITVTGEREKDVTPSLYTEVHAHFKLYGDIDTDKAEKAVSLSVEKYCSVAKTLEKNAKVTYSVEVIK